MRGSPVAKLFGLFGLANAVDALHHEGINLLHDGVRTHEPHACGYSESENSEQCDEQVHVTPPV